ncbi:MAG: peptide-methionine (S)-S-oxide reductase MsrA [Methanosarcinales archaeon]|nr:peptide-methionine (S)-S-oxide reductase MsrA [Methanosarcinales archaeon]
MKTGQAIFAGGCFWGVEYYMQKKPGVLKTTVGYIGGHKDEPSYEDVCSKTTGHVEAVEVVYDQARVSYEELVRLFFEIHDPTQAGRQGPDVGEQYSSIIFYRGDEQKAIAEKMIVILKEKGYDVVTRLKEAGKFWKAEDYHQDYYNKKRGTPYCHVYTRRFD